METALIVIAVFTGIIALSNLILLGGLAWLGMTVSRLINHSVRPTIRDIDRTIRKVHGFVDMAEARAENVLDISERTVREVSGRVVAASDMLEHAVTGPIIQASGFLAGVRRAVEVWRRGKAA